MNELTTPARPVSRYFGGKWLLAPWIIENLPEHRVYVEPFGGAASVLMQKKRSYAEVYNDLDLGVVTLFRVLQNAESAKELERFLRLTPFAREEFNLAYEASTDPIEASRRFIIRSFMGFGSGAHNIKRKSGFRANSNRAGTTPAHDWTNYPDAMKAMTARLSGVIIENRDAKFVMQQHDGPDTLHFVDPPYVHDTRSDKHNYLFEMTDKDHAELCDFLSTLNGMVVLCGYPNEIYDRLGWRTIERKALADGAKVRTEVLWFNDLAWRGQAQISLL